MSRLTASSIALAMVVACSERYGSEAEPEPEPEPAAVTEDAGGTPEPTSPDGGPPPPRNETAWAASYPGAATNVVHGVRADGAVVLAYTYDFVPDYPPVTNAPGLAVEMHDAEGRRLWGKGFPVHTELPQGVTSLMGVGFTPTGDIILAGASTASIEFGPATSFDPAGTSAVFAVRLRARDGVGVWLRTFESPDHAFADVLAVDGPNIAITGSFVGELRYVRAGESEPDGLEALTASSPSSFVGLLDADGKAKWMKAISSAVTGVALDPAGHVYVGGTFKETFEGIGDDVEALGLASNGFLASISPDGAPRWARALGDAALGSNDLGMYISAIAWGGDVLGAVGHAPAGADFGDGERFVSDPLDTSVRAFVATFDPATGLPRWKTAVGPRSTGVVPTTRFQSVAVDAWRQVVATGFFFDEIVFGSVTLSGAPSPKTNLFGLKLDGAGAPVWGKAIPNLMEGGCRVRLAPGDGYAVSGYVSGDGVDLGGGEVVDTGAGKHAFVARWSP